MHVLIVNQYALPQGSAGITRHGDLGARLVESGHRVTVIASRYNYLTRDRPAKRSAHDGVQFRWLATGEYAANDRRRVRSMVDFMFRAMRAGIRMPRPPDVVIGSSPQLLAGLSALAIARRWRVPFIFEVRDPWPSALVDLGALKEGGLAHRSLERIERLLYARADRIITVMAHADRRVSEAGEDASKCVYIPNAVSMPAAGQVPAALQQSIGAARRAGRILVLYAGAHGPSNGLTDIMEGLAVLRSRDPDTYSRISLLFIGDGSEKASLVARAAREGHENVHFHDAIDKPDLMAALGLADFALVHFARAEFKGYGMSANKLFDAMAVGVPVLLASPLADTPVDSVRCGIRYEPGSAPGLAYALQAAARTTPEERREMGQRGRTEAAERYDIRVTGRQLEKLLLEVVSART
jgi:glycosyltransferase involved in cell wall biosynthesis